MLAFLAARTESMAKKPEYLPGTLTKTKFLRLHTCGVIIGFAESITFLNESSCFLNSRLKSIAGIKIRYVFVDSFEIDTESYVKLSSFDLFVNHLGVFYCIISSN